MNLAASLLYAAERSPDAEAVVEGDARLTYAELLDRAARARARPGARAAGRRRRPLPPRHRRPLLGMPVGRGNVPPALAARVRGRPRLLPRGLRRRALARGRRAAARRRPAPGALDADERDESLMLYTSGTTGRPKGVPRSHRADRAGGLSQVVHQDYRHGDRTLGCMPLYHTMGIHSLVAMHLVGGCYVCQPDWDAGTALALIERERITSLYLAPTLFHDLVTHPRRGDFDLSSVETLAYAGAAMTSALVERCVEAFCAPAVRQPLRLDRDLHVRDPPRPGGEARVRRTARAECPAAARRERRDPLPHVLRRGVRRLLEPARRRREGDPRRLVPHRRRRPARRGRRPLARRAARRHDRQRRREHPPARGRGRARPASRACRRSPSSAFPTTASATTSSRSSSAPPPPRSSTPTASPPTRSPASSVRASTASSPSFRRARLGRSCAGCCDDGIQGFRVERDDRGVATITLDDPGEDEPRAARGARTARGAVRGARRGRRRSLRRRHRRRRALHRRRRHRRVPGGDPGAPLAAGVERRRRRAVPQAGDRANPRLLPRRRPRARPGVRLPRRRRRRPARPPRGRARDDPRLGRHPAARPPDRARPCEGRDHAAQAHPRAGRPRLGPRLRGRPGRTSSTLPSTA